MPGGRPVLLFSSWNLTSSTRTPELGSVPWLRWSAVVEPIASEVAALSQAPAGASQNRLKERYTVPDIFGWCSPCVTGVLITWFFLHVEETVELHEGKPSAAQMPPCSSTRPLVAVKKCRRPGA